MPGDDAASAVGSDAASTASSDQGQTRRSRKIGRTSAEKYCLVAGDAGPIVTRDEDQPDLLKNEASVQDAIFGVSRHCLCP